METVDPRVVEIALSRVGGTDFENFAQSFFAATIGTDYVPMGGFHDGGADGTIEESGLFSDGTSKFMQASVSADPKTKIRNTIRRLREVGRNPSSLIYATSQKLSLIDQLQENLSDEFDCRIVIRDGSYFQHQVNGSHGTIAAYKAYLAGAASFLEGIGTANTVKSFNDLPSKTLCVFLGQELERRRGKTELLEAVADSLILWALEGTDPGENIFLDEDEIKQRVLEALPSAKAFFKNAVSARLKELVTKGENGRKVNFHSKFGGYCLPYETRKKIKQENIGDETLRLSVSDVFRSRAKTCAVVEDGNSEIVEQCVEICHDVIHRSFHAQGLEVAIFLEQTEGSDANLPSVADLIRESILDRDIPPSKAPLIESACISILRGTYYNSTSEERRYLKKLSRTYILLFMLKNEPRIVEYFRGMTSNFNLYVGSDLIVRSLSECQLPKEDQMTKNALALLKAAGSRLVLTDKTLDEVWHHLRTTHLEFINNYQQIQNFMTFVLASQIDKILIRAFFYCKLERAASNGRPFTWSKFLGQFISIGEISHQSGRDELREYLVHEFGFDFEDEETLLAGIDPEQLEELATEIQAKRNKSGRDEASEEILSRNAALMVLRIYRSRKVGDERSGGNPYGFKTWWLTQQSRIRDATGQLVAKERARYMMRPEFILHFLAALPSQTAVQTSYEKIFPSVLGIKLGNRMDEAAFKEIIEKARDVYDEFDESRAKVVLAKASAQLQSDFLKQYD